MKIIIITLGLLCAVFFASCKGVSSNNAKADQAASYSIQGETKTELEVIAELVSSSKGTIVDVRTPEEFAEGHIENSVNIPLNTIADSLDTFKQYENIIVVCRSGGRSAKAKGILNKNGFSNVYNGKAWDTLNELLK